MVAISAGRVIFGSFPDLAEHFLPQLFQSTVFEARLIRSTALSPFFANNQREHRAGTFSMSKPSERTARPKTTILVEPGHRSPTNRRFSKLPCPLLTC